MAKRFFCLVVVLIFLSCGEIFGQLNPVEKFFKKDSAHYFGKFTVDFLKNNVNLYDTVNSRSLKSFMVDARIPANPFLVTLRPNPFEKKSYRQPLSFFCQKEWQFEKATSIPLRFRLGSIEYTDYLEQKPNAPRPK
jgi:hypothetical protein